MRTLNFEEIDEPIQLNSFKGTLFDGTVYKNTPAIVEIRNQLIAAVYKDMPARKNQIVIPENVLVLPGRINLHCHGREVFGKKSGDENDQTYKEDSRTLSLALAQGGATHGMCMPNLPFFIEDEESYQAQLKYINSEQPHRKAPIMPLSMYVLIRPNSKPRVINAMFKMLWNTYGATNFDNDEQVPETLMNYPGEWVTAHCETIAGIKNDSNLAHHFRRPKQAGIDAVRILLEAAKRIKFHPHIAHISCAEEVELVEQYRKLGLDVTCELTPQVITLNYETFEKDTGLPIVWAQQNPPLRSFHDMLSLREKLPYIDLIVDDHAPHTKEEKEKGISGLVQAPTTGQVFLEHVTNGGMTLADYVRKGSTTPGGILESRLGLKKGLLAPGYEASFTLVSMGKPSKIRNEDVLSKPGYTPYDKFTFSNTIEGVIIGGTLYTQKALQKLRN